MNYGAQQFIAIDAQSTDETLGIPLDARGATDITVYCVGNGTTSGGVITIEECAMDLMKGSEFKGTWSSIATVNASDVTAGVQKATHLTVAAYSWVRARISTAISGGGTVTVTMVAQ